MPTPAQMRDRYRRIVHQVRHLPGVHGLRPHTVEILLGSWSGTHTGDGTETTTATEITERNGLPPKVRWLTTEEIAVGALASGTIEIGPITPDCSVGGTSLATILQTSIATGETRHLRITGPAHPDGALYVVENVSTGSALHYMVQAKPASDA